MKPTPGRGKVDGNGNWAPLKAGEFILGHEDEQGEYPASTPVPSLLGRNGTYMVYRKLHQNVKSFRDYLNEHGEKYGGGKEKLAAKFVGRWRDATPLQLSPDKMDPDIVKDRNRNNNFTYGFPDAGKKCPMGAHVRRANPRDSLGFKGKLANRRRIVRRGLPYGQWVPEDQETDDGGEHGIVFMALNTGIERQFEFVQQQWINYGNDFQQGNDPDTILGNHAKHNKMVIQGTTDPKNPPYICPNLPDFVVTRGGDYFFLPSITALKAIAYRLVDPR